MALSPGIRLGPYEVLSPIGTGGMGEVYKAWDERLRREIALKVLPTELSRDSDRLRRFEREARAASALNHPNILTVYDIGTQDSISYIAIELVDGKTLQQHLASGPMPIKSLLDIAVQVANGMATAHDAGIIHRDLKPANIMISKTGFAKILDFGLAKVVVMPARSAGSSADTASLPETSPGHLLGTTAYMSPEQARGLPLDFRSDQFSFGALLYEMATGSRAFSGQSTADLVIAILNQEPQPIAEVRPEVPVPLRWIIERCLAKNREDRFVSTRDLQRDLATVRDRLSELSGSTRAGAPLTSNAHRSRRLLAWMAACAVIATGIVVGTSSLLKVKNPRSIVRLSVLPPEGATFNVSGSSPGPAAISPNGRLLVYGARDISGRDLLWLRPLDASSAQPLRETEGATYPFWSADGRSIGFFADAKLKRIEASGGPPQTVCDAPTGRGGTWNRGGIIVFARENNGPLWKVPAAGGVAKPLTGTSSPSAGFSHRWPQFLPDGRHFVYLVKSNGDPAWTSGIYLEDFQTGKRSLVVADASNAVYVAPGYLLYVHDGTLVARPFDWRSASVSGDPVAITEKIHYHPYRLYGAFSASESGILIYQTGNSDESQLIWFDRSARRIGPLGPPGGYGGLRISPDGTRCAVEVRGLRQETIDIWIVDLERGLPTRLTSGGSINDSPVWSRDGRRIVYTSNRNGHWQLYQRDIDARTEEPLLDRAGDRTPSDWSPDGRFLAYHVASPTGKHKRELWVLSLADGKAFPYLRSEFNQSGARFSRDGKWIAYVSDESGRPEVYVSAFPSPHGRVQVSTNGGGQPVWGPDHLFYLGADSKLMAAPLRVATAFQVDVPRAVLETRLRSSASDIPLYDLAGDGSRFLVNVAVDDQPTLPINVVLNWEAGVRR